MLWFCTRNPLEPTTTLNNLQKSWKIVLQSEQFFYFILVFFNRRINRSMDFKQERHEQFLFQGYFFL